MKITILTSNKARHNYFVHKILEFGHEVYLLQECSTLNPGQNNNYYLKSEVINNYFKKVKFSEFKVFGNKNIEPINKKLTYRSFVWGEISSLDINEISDFLKSNLYIVFGSSLIKRDLLKFLISKKAINIHMGIAPYYRGTDCNFWALYDNNSHLVGATIHLLSEKLDSGDILHHAISDYHNNPFMYTMLAVKSAFISIFYKINNDLIFATNKIKQDENLQIRYTTKKQFNDQAICDFNKKKIRYQKRNNRLLKDPYILKKNFFFEA